MSPAGPDRPGSRGPGATPVGLVLHVGMGKTGTSSVQFFLRDNREALARAGVLLPRTPGGARHGRVGLFAKTDEDLLASPEWRRQKEQDPATFRRVFRRRLRSEIAGSGLPRVLLTDEVLFGSPAPALRRLGRFLHRWTDGIRVVAYLRRQDDHMVSRYQEGVKIGWVDRLEEWMGEDMTSLYDYSARLRLHRRVLAPDELVVRSYDRACFVEGSLHQDFLDAAGIDLRADDLAQVEDRNRSLGAEAVELLRLLNLHRVRTQGARPGLIDNRALVARLAEAPPGPTLTAPASLLDPWMDQWSRTNDEVAAEHFGGSPLFPTPRRTGGTTTRQWLDPVRVGHYAELLELPADDAGALRSLAEEAARR